MTFTHDPTSSEGLLRTMIQDSDANDYRFEDNELTAVLDQNDGDLWSAAADLCRSLAAYYTKNATFVNLGKYDLVIDSRKKAEYYLQLAARFDTRTNNSIVDYWDSIDYDINGAGVDGAEYIGNE